MSSGKIELEQILKKLAGSPYCIIKLPAEFPDYRAGSDLDIFCYDTAHIARIISESLQDYISKSITLRLTKMPNQMYLDILDNGSIHLRFDLYGALPNYKNVNIKSGFFSSVIENSQILSFPQFSVKVPSHIDEALLRYIEYHEWFVQRPDKIKHIDYIENSTVKRLIDKEALLDKLHYYVEIPPIAIDESSSGSGLTRYFNYYSDLIRRALSIFQQKGLIYLLKTVCARLKK